MEGVFLDKNNSASTVPKLAAPRQQAFGAVVGKAPGAQVHQIVRVRVERVAVEMHVAPCLMEMSLRLQLQMQQRRRDLSISTM